MKRSVLVVFRCRLSEKKLLMRAAKARRKKLPVWIRATLLKAARPRR